MLVVHPKSARQRAENMVKIVTQKTADQTLTLHCFTKYDLGVESLILGFSARHMELCS